MKQFIYSSGPAIIAALHNKAVVTVQSGKEDPSNSKSSSYELVAPPTKEDPNQNTQETSKKKKKKKQRVTTTSEEQKDGNNDNEHENEHENEHDNNNKNTNDESKEEVGEKGGELRGKSNQAMQLSSNAIQAVVCQHIAQKDSNDKLICVVSRYDKTLCTYIINMEQIATADNANDDTVEVTPMTTVRTPKRCSTLAFATLPSSVKEKNDDDNVEFSIVTGDLNGDAYAYPISTTTESTSTSSAGKKRLLLGHTASILTSIKVIQNNEKDGGLIFTSDRDEKVRISSFPKAFHVRGYLLGNTSYITDMDVHSSSSSSSASFCVTSGGDGTIRLYDYTNCTELDCYHYFPKKENNNTEEGDKMDVDNENKDEVAKDAQSSSTSPPDGQEQNHNTPVRIAIQNDGSKVAVLRDGINTIDLFQIIQKKDDSTASSSTLSSSSSSSSSTSIKLIKMKQSITCPERPLAIHFCKNDGSLCILMREPTFFVQLTPPELDTIVNDTTEKTKDDQGALGGGKSHIREIGSRLKVTMPSTLLEADDSGKVKLKKDMQQERDNFVKHEPWLSVERVEKAKLATQRHNKRKREKEREKRKAANL